MTAKCLTFALAPRAAVVLSSHGCSMEIVLCGVLNGVPWFALSGRDGLLPIAAGSCHYYGGATFGVNAVQGEAVTLHIACPGGWAAEVLPAVRSSVEAVPSVN